MVVETHSTYEVNICRESKVYDILVQWRSVVTLFSLCIFAACTPYIGLCYICFLLLVVFFGGETFCPSLWLQSISRTPDIFMSYDISL